MKNVKQILLVIIAAAFSVTSCTKDEIANATDTNTVVASATIDAINELDFKTGTQVTFENSLSKSTNKLTVNSLVGACATITVDNLTPNVFPKVITIDFGTGCTANNITRKGKLKVTLSGLVSTPKATMKIERENYYVNGLKVEGTVVYVNETVTPNIPQWSRTITNGKLTNLEGMVFFNSGTHTIKQMEGVGTPLVLSDNTYEMTQGNHTVSKENGPSLTLTVAESLIKKYDCNYVSKGKLTVKGSLLNGTIDYENGDCDNKFTYTHENGVVLKRRFFFEFKSKLSDLCKKKKMTLQIETPALLFSATSLILLAYTNRFLTLATIIRGLKKAYKEKENNMILLEIKNLNLRLTLIRYMQMAGVMSLFLSVFAMLLLYLNQQIAGIYLFGFSLLALLLSLGLSFWEINISVGALRLHLSDLTQKEKTKDYPANTIDK